MSKIIATRAIRGAHKLVARAERELIQAIEARDVESQFSRWDQAQRDGREDLLSALRSCRPSSRSL